MSVINKRIGRIFSYILNKIWLALAVIIILIALVTVVLRLSLPYINYFKTDIQNWLEKTYQIQVEASEINAEWLANGPVLTAQNFTLKPTNQQPDLISIKKFSVQLDFLGSLINRNIITRKIQIDGAALKFNIDRKLGLRINTSSADNDDVGIENTSQFILSTFFGQKSLTLSNSQLTLQTMNGNLFHYKMDEFFIDNFGDIHQIRGQLSDDSGADLTMIAEIYGEPSRQQSYANLYLEGQGVTLTKLPIFGNQTHLKPESGEVNWKLWGEWKNKKWQSAIGQLKLADIVWKNASENNPENSTENSSENSTELVEFSADFSWNFKQQNNGVLHLKNINLTQPQQTQNEIVDIFLLYSELENHAIQWDLLLHDLQVAPLAPYLDVIFSYDPAHNNLFKQLHLKLDLERLGLRFLKKNGVWHLPKLKANFSDLNYTPMQSIPGINGLQGKISFSYGHGTTELTGNNLEFSYKKLFRNSITVKQIDASMDWYTGKSQTPKLNVNSLLIHNEDLTINLTGKYFTQDELPHLALYAELTKVNLAKKSSYLPALIMNEDLVEHLDKGVKSGTLSQAKAFLRGPLNSFPYKNNQGVFAASGNIENTVYQYLADWPAAKNLSAQLNFSTDDMQIIAKHATAENNSVKQALAIIDSFSAEDSSLKLFFETQSSNNSGIEFLANTPLTELHDSLSEVKLSGKQNLQMNLSMPLNDTNAYSLQGKVSMDSKQNKVEMLGMTFDNIQGILNFDENNVRKSQLTASYYQQPVEVKILTPLVNGKQQVQLTAKGKMSAKVGKDFLGEPWDQLLQGESQFQADIHFVSGEMHDYKVIKLYSDLQGIEIDLPGELYKAKNSTMPLNLKLNIGEVSRASIQYGLLNNSLDDSLNNPPNKPPKNLLTGKWQWHTKNNQIELDGGVFYYNLAKSLPQDMPSQFTLDARIKQLDYNIWSAKAEKILDQLNAGESAKTLEINVNLKIDDFISDWVDLSSLKLALHKNKKSNWVLGIDSQPINGLITFKQQQPWEIHLNRFKLQLKHKQAQQANNQQQNAQQNNLQPQKSWEKTQFWPELNLLCEDCTIGKTRLGKVDAKLRKKSGQLTFSGKMLFDENLDFNFDLFWSQPRQTKNNNLRLKNIKNSTHMKFQLSSENLGKLLDSWQYSSGIEESSANVKGELSWEETPWNIATSLLKGKASFKLTKGYLSKISDEKARLFSLLNLQSLSRRLQLDFKDIYKKGFFYDKITGDLQIADNILSTENTQVDGNAAEIELAGIIDLQQRVIDQKAIVTPRLTSSLPVLLGWAVEPTTGLLVYLLNKLVEPAVDVVTQVEYHISGSIDNADNIRVEQIGKKQAKKKISKQQIEKHKAEAEAEDKTPQLEQENQQQIEQNQTQ